MKLKNVAMAGLLSAALIGPAQSVFAQGQETTIVVMPEEYQLRVLEEQIQMLRHKLYMRQKMTDEERAQWAKQYKDVADRLQKWNTFTDEYDVGQ